MANKNLFTKFASLAMAGALAFSAVPVAGLSGVLDVNASTAGWITSKANESYVYYYNPGAVVTIDNLVKVTSNDGTVATPNSGTGFYYSIYDDQDVKVSETTQDDVSTDTFALKTAGNFTLKVTSGDPDSNNWELVSSEIPIEVRKRNLSDATVTLSQDNVNYDGKYHGSVVAVGGAGNDITFKPSEKMPWNVDFSIPGTSSDVHYDRVGGVDAGEYDGTLESIGDNFTGSKTGIKFKINKFVLDQNSVKGTEGEADDAYGNIYVKADSAAYANGNNVDSKVTVKVCLETGKLTTLEEGKDYTVSCVGTNKGKNAGTATIEATEDGNFKGRVTATYNIVDEDKNLSNATIELKNGSKSVNDGDSVDFVSRTTGIDAGASVVKVPDENGKLVKITEDTHYRIEYDTNDEDYPGDAGVVVVKFIGIGDYAGEATRTLTIAPKDISKVTFTNNNPTQKYDGTAKEPTFTATGLVEGEDFVVNYDNNINAGTAMANIVGLGNYAGVKGEEFTISRQDMTNVSFDSIPNQIYNGTAVEPALSLKYKNADNQEFTLVAGEDYTAEYTKNNAVGKGRVTVKGVGNYDGTKYSDFLIKDAANDIANAEVTLAEDAVAYDGKYHSASVKSVKMKDANGNLVPLTNNTDYTVKNISEKEVGTYNVVIEAKGDTYGGSISVPFQITGYDVKDAGFSLKKSSVKYNGKNQKPELVVASGTRYDGKDMVEGTDYEVSGIKNIKNVGKLTVKVTGLGAYAGSEQSFTFKVTKADQPMTVKAKTATVKKSKLDKKNQTVKASKVLTVKKNEGSVSYKKNSGNSKIKVASNGKVTVKKGLKKGTYKVKVTVTAKGNSNYNSGSKTVTFKIKVK